MEGIAWMGLCFGMAAMLLVIALIPFNYADLEGLPTIPSDFFEVKAEGSFMDLVNGANTVIVEYQPTEDNTTFQVGAFMRVSSFTSSTPQVVINYHDIYGTHRSIAMRYGGGGGYIVNWVGAASFQFQTMQVSNDSTVYLVATTINGCTCSCYGWIAELVG